LRQGIERIRGLLTEYGLSRIRVFTFDKCRRIKSEKDYPCLPAVYIIFNEGC